MADTTYLDWPFFEPRHRELARARRLGRASTSRTPRRRQLDADLPRAGASLGAGGWLRHAVAGTAMAARARAIDTRAICLIRETLARHSGLADFAFAMQGLGSGAISWPARPQKRATCRGWRGRGDRRLCAVRARGRLRRGGHGLRRARDGDHYVLDGEKTWISNGGIADFYVVFARTGEAPGARHLGLHRRCRHARLRDRRAHRRDRAAPAGALRFTNCRVPPTQRIGEAGEGFKVAMRTLDVFRTSVAAAALGFARRALDEALQRATTPQDVRPGVLADFQLTQAKLAQMATTIDSAALLTYRAAWQRDQGQRVTREAAMAKMVPPKARSRSSTRRCRCGAAWAWSAAQPVERLYREIRALRIYEGRHRGAAADHRRWPHRWRGGGAATGASRSTGAAG
jgi:acyl-CoA dehydrogenase